MTQTRAGSRREQLPANLVPANLVPANLVPANLVPANLDPVIKRLAKKEFENILFRSNRAALMEYEVASKLDKELLLFEYIFYAVGVCGFAVSFFSDVLSKAIGGTENHVFYYGILAAFPSAIIVFLKCLTEFLSKDTSTFVPFLRRRVVAHNNAAAKWQNLERQAQLYLILLEKPGVTYTELEEWLKELLKERKDICMNVVVNSDDHKKYNNEDLLKENISSRKKVYTLYKSEKFNTVDQTDTSYSDDE